MAGKSHDSIEVFQNGYIYGLHYKEISTVVSRWPQFLHTRRRLVSVPSTLWRVLITRVSRQWQTGHFMPLPKSCFWVSLAISRSVFRSSSLPIAIIALPYSQGFSVRPPPGAAFVEREPPSLHQRRPPNKSRQASGYCDRFAPTPQFRHDPR